MVAGDVLAWVSALSLLRLCGFVVTTVAMLISTRALEPLDWVIELLGWLYNPIEDLIDYGDEA